eukprot:TRINITY_DN30950_c0_g1_i1.p1 TRINITY_DN30950_c0_g1~~TRINITY_DN30950_c0_g1_i1.p1  ORF type:complete len:234 (+),score=51.29 TRINITY_DN30950_c0_g1_i1:48-704(+)
MFGGLRQAAALGARRVTAQPLAREAFARAPTTHGYRAFAAAPSAWQQRAAAAVSATAPKLAAPSLVLPKASAAALAPSALQKAATTTSTQHAAGGLAKVGSDALVFEIGLTFTFTHYISIFQSFARCLFQAFRPLLILFVFGQLIKAAFFMMGAPLWFSFYSIWLFEVGYGLAQCAISFIFISFFYNNCSFARVRPSLLALFRQQREKLAAAARAVAA